jgi:hypothetical protein
MQQASSQPFNSLYWVHITGVWYKGGVNVVDYQVFTPQELMDKIKEDVGDEEE